MAPVLQELFDSDVDYTLVGTEISAGVARLIDGRPDDATFFVPFTSSVNSVWGDGVLTGTNNGGTLGGGKITFNGGPASQQYVDWNAALNAASPQTGCFRIKVTPNYSGSPADSVAQMFLVNSSSSTSLVNLIQIFHLSTGALGFAVYDSSGNNAILFNSDPWSPVSGTQYEIELNYDFTAGATRLFLNGTQFGATVATTLTRSSSIGLLRTGENATPASLSANFAVHSIVIFSSPQHVANYSVTADPSELLFSTGTVENLAEVSAEKILAFEPEISITGSDTVKFGLLVNDVLKWYNTVADEWQNSDGTAAQLNLFATWTEDVLADLLSENSIVRMFIRLTSGDGATNPSIDEASITFDYGAIEPDDPSLCLVTFYVKKLNGDPVRGATVSFLPAPNEKQYLEASSNLIAPDAITDITDANGYGDVYLIKSSEFEGGPMRYRVEIKYPSGKQVKVRNATTGELLTFLVPDDDTVDLTAQLLGLSA